MSSGFLPGGTVDTPLERSDEWLVAQKEIEANRQRKAEQARQANGKSLFETLEANKAAKQEAFEEANRLKNQFRALDQDEVEFLDSVLESTRKEEERVKRETAEGLAQFRQQQEEADKKARRSSDTAGFDEESAKLEEDTWIVGGRKRKRTKEKEVLKGVKARRLSASTDLTKTFQASQSPSKKSVKEEESGSIKPAVRPQLSATSLESKPRIPTTSMVIQKSPASLKGGLVSYGSDEDDDL